MPRQMVMPRQTVMTGQAAMRALDRFASVELDEQEAFTPASDTRSPAPPAKCWELQPSATSQFIQQHHAGLRSAQVREKG